MRIKGSYANHAADRLWRYANHKEKGAKAAPVSPVQRVMVFPEGRNACTVPLLQYESMGQGQGIGWKATIQKEETVTPELKIKARSAVFIALNRGRLTKGPCADCGTTEGVEAHHEDYEKPLEVIWLCKEHHVARHAALVISDARPTDTIELAMVWKCRQCEHRWMVDDLAYPPRQCPNRECRAIAWYRPKLKEGRPPNTTPKPKWQGKAPKSKKRGKRDGNESNQS